jgi:stage II sporulation protein D
MGDGGDLQKEEKIFMRKTMLAALGMTALVFLLPLLLGPGGAPAAALEQQKEVEVAVDEAEEPTPQQDPSPASTAEPEADQSAAAEPQSTADSAATVEVLLEGQAVTLTMEEYLWGVVAAEMPASFEQEALKAQAIAARTYTQYRIAHPTGSHTTPLCGDSTCCQAWISRADRLAQWPEEKAETYAQKITDAIRETDGQQLTSGGEPILAVFHAASGGRTRSAETVWGAAYPYLVSVESPEGEDAAPNYYSTTSLSASEFRTTFLAKYPNADLEGTPETWFGDMIYDEDGLPYQITVGGVTVTTAQLRSLFGLRSPTLTVEATEDTVTFYVTGYGHGVGMSQYGANALAQAGKTAAEILSWYYPGTALE